MHNGSLKRRIIFVFSLLFLVLITALSVILNYYIRHNYASRDQVSLQSLTHSLSQQFFSTLNEMNKYSVLVYFSNDITNSFSKFTDVTIPIEPSKSSASTVAAIESQLESIVGIDITRYIINLYNANVFCSTKSYSINWNKVAISLSNGLAAQIQQRLKETTKAEVIFIPSAYWSDDVAESTGLLCVSRNFINHNTKKNLGIIQVLLPIKYIYALFKPISTDQIVCITDQSGTVLFCTAENTQEQQEMIENMSAEQRKTRSGILRTESGIEYYYCQSELSSFNLNVCMLQIYNAQSYLKYTGIIFAASFALYLICIILVTRISHKLSNPLDRIVASLRSVSWDNFDMNLKQGEHDGDFEVLEDSYKAMMKKLRESMNLVLATRENEQRAIYMALQSQISPHFLNNTIAGISACAYENGVEKIVEICDKLSLMLRYATDYTETFSTMETELSYAENYLELMKIRYDGKFFYHVTYCETLAMMPLPRLLIQTVVENCFKHSFEGSELPWFIDIRIRDTALWWICEITYNGTAIPQDKLDEILAQSEELYRNIAQGQKRLKMGGLGLLNSITRLRILYGNQVCFEVERLDQSTCVTRFGGRKDALSRVDC